MMDQDSAAETKLDSMMLDAQKLEQTVRELLDQVEFIKNSDVRGKRWSEVGDGCCWLQLTIFNNNNNKSSVLLFLLLRTSLILVGQLPGHTCMSRATLMVFY